MARAEAEVGGESRRAERAHPSPHLRRIRVLRSAFEPEARFPAEPRRLTREASGRPPAGNAVPVSPATMASRLRMGRRRLRLPPPGAFHEREGERVFPPLGDGARVLRPRRGLGT